MRLLLLVGVIALSGCHLIFPFATESMPTGEVGPGEASPTDAPLAYDLRLDAVDARALDASSCEWSAFSTPVPVQGVNTSEIEWTPHLAGHGLVLYFSSNRPGSTGLDDLWVATRSSATAPFGAPTNLAELNSLLNDNDVSVSEDQLEIFFSVGINTIMRSSRPTPADTFSPPEAVQGLTPLGAGGSAGACLAPGGLELYYHLSGPDFDLAVATRTSVDSPFTFVRTLDEVNSSDIEGWPTISANGLELFFEATRPATGARIYRATRASTTQPFDQAALVEELSVGIESGDPHLSADGKTMTFAVKDTDNNWDLYVAKRTCLP